jgi:hypothetical protein
MVRLFQRKKKVRYLRVNIVLNEYWKLVKQTFLDEKCKFRYLASKTVEKQVLKRG